MGNASIRPAQPSRYLYHANLCYMEANGYRNPLSMKMFGLALEGILREYGLNYLQRRKPVFTPIVHPGCRVQAILHPNFTT